MKAKKIMYALAGVIQFTYKFNKENNTHIEYTREILDGSLFVTIDFKETPFQLIFEYTYELGRIQNYLAGKREEFLPLESYPFPPEDDKNIANFHQTKQELFDGDEEKCLHKIFNVDEQKVTVTDFYNSPLRTLKKEIDAESFDKITEESKFNLIKTYNEIYTSEEGLEVHYLIRNEMIYLFSYGEYQLGRYRLFLEGVWYYKPWSKDE